MQTICVAQAELAVAVFSSSWVSWSIRGMHFDDSPVQQGGLCGPIYLPGSKLVI